MRLMILIAVLFGLAGQSPRRALAEPPTTRPAHVELPDLDGATQRPLEPGEARAVVILFIGTDCPISNSYAPEINRLCEQYKSRKVQFYLVHCDAELSLEEARKHAKEFEYACPVLMDRRHELAKRVGATVTPEAAVIGATGEVLYRGRIDDLYYTLGKRRYEATTHELKDAIESAITGRAVATPRTRALGCAIGE